MPTVYGKGIHSPLCYSFSPWMFSIACLRRSVAVACSKDKGHLIIKHQCTFYADDVILFVAPSVEEIQVITQILSIFEQASSLCTNLEKCSISVIYGCSEEALLD